MPQGNGTGPAGAGPMTGRGLGTCAGPRTANRRAGQGRGFFRNHAPHTVATTNAMVLQEQIDSLHAEIAELSEKLKQK